MNMYIAIILRYFWGSRVALYFRHTHIDLWAFTNFSRPTSASVWRGAGPAMVREWPTYFPAEVGGWVTCDLQWFPYKMIRMGRSQTHMCHSQKSKVKLYIHFSGMVINFINLLIVIFNTGFPIFGMDDDKQQAHLLRHWSGTWIHGSPIFWCFGGHKTCRNFDEFWRRPSGNKRCGNMY